MRQPSEEAPPATAFSGCERQAYLLLCSAATVWLLAIFAAPAALYYGHAGLSGWIYLFFHPLCHQRPERSFAFVGYQLAVCHRCLGLYVGFWVGSLALPVWRRAGLRLLERPRLLALFSVPLIVDLLVGNTPATRFTTGFVAAFPFAIFVWIALAQLIERTPLLAGRNNR